MPKDQQSATRPTQGTGAASRTHSARFDSRFSTGTQGLTNARTKIVGERTGFLADLIVAIVQLTTVAWAAVTRVFARVATVVTPLGWTMLAAVPLCLALGYALGWVELVVIGFMILSIIAIAVVYLIGRSPVTIDLAVPHSRVVVGTPADGRIVVSNPSRRRAVGALVEVPIGSGLIEVALPGLARGAEIVREFVIPTARRGVVFVGPVRTVRADPVGLVRRELVWADRAELFVHPRTIGIPSMSTGLVRDLEGSPTKDLSNNDVSFHALREYMPGDERRNIHWKSTARTGTYMVRQFEETRRSHLVIALSLATSDYVSDEEFEMAVSVAGSLGVRAILDARTVTVVASESTPAFAKHKVFAVRRLSTITRSRLLDDLAVVDRSETALSIVDVARVSGEQATGVSVAFLVCGSGATPQELRAASTKFPAGIEVVVVRCDPNSSPGLRRVAGLTVLTIGYLDDLKSSLSRSVAA